MDRWEKRKEKKRKEKKRKEKKRKEKKRKERRRKEKKEKEKKRADITEEKNKWVFRKSLSLLLFMCLSFSLFVDYRYFSLMSITGYRIGIPPPAVPHPQFPRFSNWRFLPGQTILVHSGHLDISHSPPPPPPHTHAHTPAQDVIKPPPLLFLFLDNIIERRQTSQRVNENDKSGTQEREWMAKRHERDLIRMAPTLPHLEGRKWSHWLSPFPMRTIYLYFNQWNMF